MLAADIIRVLDLKPHPEGGHYRETFRDPRLIDGRAASTAILFLLARGERSHWHRIDAVEIWHYYAGAALKLSVVDGASEEIIRLGGDIAAGEVPQVTVPARAWQAAESLGDWTLVGCTVAPGFTFEGFELAPAGWSPRGENDNRHKHAYSLEKKTWMAGTSQRNAGAEQTRRSARPARARQPHDRQRRRARRLRPRHHAASDRSGPLSDVALARARAGAAGGHSRIHARFAAGEADRNARLYGERVIHGEIYKARPDVNAVCHHHAPSILPFCISGMELKPVYHLGATMGDNGAVLGQPR